MYGAKPWSREGSRSRESLPIPRPIPARFQNEGIHDELAPAGSAPIPDFYQDSVVVAYKRSASDVPVASLEPKITASGGSPDVAMLEDGDVEKTTKIPIPAVGESAWIQYEFPAPQA